MKTSEEAMDLIESMAASDIVILRDRAHIPTKKSLLELTSQNALLAQNKLLSKQLEALTETLNKLPTPLHSAQTSHSSILQVTGCTICGGAPSTISSSSTNSSTGSSAGSSASYCLNPSAF